MIKKEEYLLRIIEEKDLAKVLEWRNSDRIRKNMFTDRIIKLEEHKGWFARINNDIENIYLIFEKNDEPLGLIYFTDIDYKEGKCNLGFYLGEENTPRGTGNKMGKLGLEYAFRVLKIKKIYGEVLAFNERSIKYFLKLGFSLERIFKNKSLKDGVYYDVLLFAMEDKDCIIANE